MNEKTLAEEKVQDEFCLHLILKPKNGMTIYLKTPTGKTVVVDADSTDNILSIKEKVAFKEGTPANEQELRFYTSQEPL